MKVEVYTDGSFVKDARQPLCRNNPLQEGVGGQVDSTRGVGDSTVYGVILLLSKNISKTSM